MIPHVQGRVPLAGASVAPSIAAVQPLSQPDVTLVLERIQTSLTALHERMNTIEHIQQLVLAQPTDPWTSLLRIFTRSRSGTSSPLGYHLESGYRSPTNRPLPVIRTNIFLRVMYRFLGTLRRAVIDLSFVLVVTSLLIAVYTGIRGRGRGGRRALVAFWLRVGARMRAAGRGLRGVER